jgi:hypothetical protein
MGRRAEVVGVMAREAAVLKAVRAVEACVVASVELGMAASMGTAEGAAEVASMVVA